MGAAQGTGQAQDSTRNRRLADQKGQVSFETWVTIRGSLFGPFQRAAAELAGLVDQHGSLVRARYTRVMVSHHPRLA